MGNLVFQATLGGQVNLVGPNTASTFNLNVPAVSSTLATLTGTETFTNKTLTSPTLTTPVLGTPSSGTLTNCTGLPNAGLVNSSVTVGSTAISLGGTATTVAGLTSLASNTLTSAASTALTIQSAGTTAVTIDTSQNVGIGTTTPSLTGATKALTINAPASGNYSAIELASAGAATANFIANSSNVYIGSYTNIPFVFQTNNTERMRIDTSGNLLVGQTSSNNAKIQLTQATTATESATFTNSSASPYGLGITFSGADPNNATNYILAGYDSFASVFMYRIYSNGTVAARSDARWKKNVETTRNGYAEDLSKLRVVKYNWYNQDDGAPKELGFIAQEVEQVFPNLVQTDPVMKKREVTDEQRNVTEEEYQDGTSKSIKTSVFVPMLVKAIQELKAINDTQAETLTQQTEAINALTARVVALEAK